MGVVVDEPLVEIVLQGLDALVEGLAHLEAEELVEHRAVEALDETIGLRRLHFGATMLDAIEVEIEFVRVSIGAAELSAIVGENGLHRQIELVVERQHVVVQHRS